MDVTPTHFRSWRVGDVERHATCAQLADHFAAGRLRHDELDRRLTAACAAVTQADLAALVADLPPLAPPVQTSPPPCAVRPSRSVSATVEALAALSAVGALAVVAFMILGAAFLGPGILLFTLVGGSLTAYSVAVLTRLLVPRHTPAPPLRAAVVARVGRAR